MKSISYKTSGTCSQLINLIIDDDDCISDVDFVGGCSGNLQGICSLIRGMNIHDVKERLNGIRCGYKSTSCPDQLCRAIDELCR
ncbi:TIGR03905 family TSCPD domain-containing protein [uncultured Prevotella sp.]|uniref:TIGR03905 family TSCPD domain-containing protein n=1 Tax=uncultured Prevotella sp. TaxID=159272 RepID=UPI002620713D|nr:TIGR03905 family TSCPD domain-containing protein [uncultured Prevotella sp.]